MRYHCTTAGRRVQRAIPGFEWTEDLLDADDSGRSTSVPSDNMKNQRTIATTASIHHRNQVFSMNWITALSLNDRQYTI